MGLSRILIAFFLFANIQMYSQTLSSEREKLKVNRILYKEFKFHKNKSINILEHKLGYKLNSLKSIFLTVIFLDELELSSNEYNLIKLCAKNLGQKLKDNNQHLLMVNKDKYFFRKIYRGKDIGNNKKYDYLLSDNIPKKYKNHYYKEIVKIIEDKSRF